MMARVLKSIKTDRQAGFTVPEMLVALALSALVMVTVITMYQGQTTSSAAQQSVINMQQNLRAALYTMEMELLMAGYHKDYQVPNIGGVDPSIPGTGIIAANSTSITFAYFDPERTLDDVDNNGDGVTDESGEKDGIDNDCDFDTDEADEIVTITYSLYDSQGDGDTDLGRQEGCQAIQPLLLNVDQVEFFYRYMHLTDTHDPSTAVPASATSVPGTYDRANIRSIGISILVRSETPEMGYTDQLTYTPLSGTTVWGPYNDHFRRQLLTVTVKPRNLGGSIIYDN